MQGVAVHQGRLQPVVADAAALSLSAEIFSPARLSQAAPQGLTGVTPQTPEQNTSDLLAVLFKPTKTKQLLQARFAISGRFYLDVLGILGCSKLVAEVAGVLSQVLRTWISRQGSLRSLDRACSSFSGPPAHCQPGRPPAPPTT